MKNLLEIFYQMNEPNAQKKDPHLKELRIISNSLVSRIRFLFLIPNPIITRASALIPVRVRLLIIEKK